MWEGGECWIIGGGPSIPHEFGVPEDVINGVLSKKLPLDTYSPYLSPIHDKHVIGINAAFLLGEWIDILFFGDGAFYLHNKEPIDAFSKIKATCHPGITQRKDVHDIKYIPRNLRHPCGVSSREGTVSWNLNSGGCAIGLAYWLGVKRVYLLGFDMTLGDVGNQHWHRHYVKEQVPQPRDPRRTPFARHRPQFQMIANDAKKLGLEIINVCPNSVLKVFERVKLTDVL